MVPKFTDNPPWCIVHGLSCKAAAPTGIAAANVEVEGGGQNTTPLAIAVAEDRVEAVKVPIMI